VYGNQTHTRGIDQDVGPGFALGRVEQKRPEESDQEQSGPDPQRLRNQEGYRSDGLETADDAGVQVPGAEVNESVNAAPQEREPEDQMKGDEGRTHLVCIVHE
jgi:hypothetical protein